MSEQPPRTVAPGPATSVDRAPATARSRQAPFPTRIVLHQVSRKLEIEFDDGVQGLLPFEFLRVYSPSAEVQGHGPGQEVLQVGKQDVDIVSVEPVGHYAIQPTFSDGHTSGIFSWSHLHRLAREHAQLWAGYLDRLQAAGQSRAPASVSAVAVDAGSGPGSEGRGSREGNHFGAQGGTSPRRDARVNESGPTDVGAAASPDPRNAGSGTALPGTTSSGAARPGDAPSDRQESSRRGDAAVSGTGTGFVSVSRRKPGAADR